MPAGRESRIHDEMSLFGLGTPIFLTIDATNTSYQMKPYEQNIRAITALSDAAAIIILPSVGEAAGKFYYICAPTGAAAGDISVYEHETGAELATYGDLDADDDYVILFSDGVVWRVAVDGVA